MKRFNENIKEKIQGKDLRKRFKRFNEKILWKDLMKRFNEIIQWKDSKKRFLTIIFSMYLFHYFPFKLISRASWSLKYVSLKFWLFPFLESIKPLKLVLNLSCLCYQIQKLLLFLLHLSINSLLLLF